MAFHERLSLRNLYLYLVCLVMLVISIFAAVSLVRGAVALAYPDPGYYFPAKEPGISEEEQRRAEQMTRDSQRRQGVLDLVGSGTLLLVAGPLYVYHWRRVQTERRVPPPAPAATP